MAELTIDFAGIGVAKSGTTWIAKCLDEHPGVCMALGKETNYFLVHSILSSLPVNTRYYGRSHQGDGFDWYRSRFEHRRPGQIAGEYSNAYLGDPESARLLHEHNPRVKLLCCFRNPVDMMYAAYYQLSRVQPLPDSFEETLRRYPAFHDYGRYRHNLEPFLARFPREQMLLMLHEDMRADPPAFFRRICEFLGVDPEVRPPSVGQRVNPRTVVRSRRIRDLRAASGCACCSGAPASGRWC
jgi:hypothetical protein